MKAVEANLDGLIGPTHNYAGLSFGNVASEKNARSISHPKKAALQGLQKMKFLHDLGIPQLIMPPQPRPDLKALNHLGFQDIASAPQEVLHKIYSASSMWTANAATVSPSADTADGKVHFTVANLASYAHRAIEAPVTAHILEQIFPGDCFVHHPPLPASMLDEGAANHMRLCGAYGEKGTEIFVHGGQAKKYPARQSLQAQEAIARAHKLDPARVIFLPQCAEAIDAGVFHNDVIAMSNERLLIYHEKAYETIEHPLDGYKSVIIRQKELSLSDAVASYFFNSQLITLPSGKIAVIAPKECEENSHAHTQFLTMIDQGIIHKVHYLDVRESMKNGGGPACLRLRIVLTDEERESVLPSVWLNDSLYQILWQWIEKHYRDTITPSDLRDPMLAKESSQALGELSEIIKINMGAA